MQTQKTQKSYIFMLHNFVWAPLNFSNFRIKGEICMMYGLCEQQAKNTGSKDVYNFCCIGVRALSACPLTNLASFAARRIFTTETTQTDRRLGEHAEINSKFDAGQEIHIVRPPKLPFWPLQMLGLIACTSLPSTMRIKVFIQSLK